jgi:hypothetical protein
LSKVLLSGDENSLRYLDDGFRLFSENLSEMTLQEPTGRRTKWNECGHYLNGCVQIDPRMKIEPLAVFKVARMLGDGITIGSVSRPDKNRNTSHCERDLTVLSTRSDRHLTASVAFPSAVLTCVKLR